MTYEIIPNRSWTRTTMVEQFRQFIENAEADQDDAAVRLFTEAVTMLEHDMHRLHALNEDLLALRRLVEVTKHALNAQHDNQ